MTGNGSVLVQLHAELVSGGSCGHAGYGRHAAAPQLFGAGQRGSAKQYAWSALRCYSFRCLAVQLCSQTMLLFPHEQSDVYSLLTAGNAASSLERPASILCSSWSACSAIG